MSYIKTYIFGDTTSIGRLIKNGDRILITCQFTIDDTGDNVTYLASDKGLYITRYGSTKMEFNFDDFFLAPNEYTFEVQDREDEFNNLLYDGADVDKINKDFFVKIELKHPGGVYATKFSGHNIVENTADDGPKKKIHIFTILPQTNILNETQIFKNGWDATKFFPTNANTYPNNPLGLHFNDSDIYPPITWDWIYLKAKTGQKGLINEIFKLINPDIVITIIQNWLFYGKYGASVSSTLTFDDLILDGNWIGSVFAEDKHPEIKTVGDLLMLLAFEYGCVAGVQSQDSAFFKQVYYVDEDDLQTLEPLVSGYPKKKYKYSKIDFAKVTSSFYQQDLGQMNRYVEQQFKPSGQAPGGLTVDKNQGDNGLEKEIISCAACPMIGLPFRGTIGELVSNLKALISGENFYSIYAVKNPTFGIVGNLYPYDCPTGFFPLPVSLAEYNYTLKGLLYKIQVYEFRVRGLAQNFLQGFAYNGFYFSPVSIEEDFDEGTTTLEAIKVSTLTVTGGDGGGGEAVDTILTVMSMESVPQEAPFNYSQLVNSDEDPGVVIANIKAGEWLDGFVIVVLQAFGANQISEFKIYDGSEILCSINMIKGKFGEVVVQRIDKAKKYTSDDTIYMKLIKGGSTAISGDGNILIKKLKKAA